MNKVKDTCRESDAEVPLLTVGSPRDIVLYFYLFYFLNADCLVKTGCIQKTTSQGPQI